MLAKDFTAHDNDYITLKSRAELKEDFKGDCNKKAMLALAKQGQINAVQDYFKKRDTRINSDPQILKFVQSLLGQEKNFEERFAVSLYLLDKGYKSQAEIEKIQRVYKLEDDSDVCKFGMMHLYETLQMGQNEVLQAFFSQTPSAVLCERYAEVVAYSHSLVLFRNANSILSNAQTLVAAKIYHEYEECNSDTPYIFAFSNFIKRCGHSKKAENIFRKLAGRKLSFDAEIEQ